MSMRTFPPGRSMNQGVVADSQDRMDVEPPDVLFQLDDVHRVVRPSGVRVGEPLPIARGLRDIPVGRSPDTPGRGGGFTRPDERPVAAVTCRSKGDRDIRVVTWAGGPGMDASVGTSGLCGRLLQALPFISRPQKQKEPPPHDCAGDVPVKGRADQADPRDKEQDPLDGIEGGRRRSSESRWPWIRSRPTRR